MITIVGSHEIMHRVEWNMARMELLLIKMYKLINWTLDKRLVEPIGVRNVTSSFILVMYKRAPLEQVKNICTCIFKHLFCYLMS